MNGLVNRHGIFYFRIRIPSKLSKAFDNRRDIWKSLGSRSEQDAKRLCVILTGRVEQLLNLTRSGSTGGGHTGFDGMVNYQYEHKPKYLFHGHQHYGQETMCDATKVFCVYGWKVMEI